MSSGNRNLNLKANVGDNEFSKRNSALEPGTSLKTIHRIPPEILLSIFEIVFRKEEDEEYYKFDCESYTDILSMAVMPDSVANVCTYWDFVTSLQPKFWQRDLILMDPMEPNPLSRLQKRLERNRQTEDLRIKVWTPDVDSWLEWRPAPGKVRGGDNQTMDKDVRSSLERERIARLVPLIQKHVHRATSLAVATMFEDSLPTPESVFPSAHPNGTRSIEHLNFLSRPDMRKAQAPTSGMSWKNVGHSTPLVYPDPAIHTALEPSHFSALAHLLLFGKTFVSFCRRYLMLQGGKYNAIGSGSMPMAISIENVFPFDGGTETPFTFDEFLQIIRLFCGRLLSLRIRDVRLPFPLPREGRIQFLEDYPWITCEDGESDGDGDGHLECLEGISIKNSNGELVLGILRLFEPHILLDRGEWEMRGTYHFSNWKEITTQDLENQLVREPGVLMSGFIGRSS